MNQDITEVSLNISGATLQMLESLEILNRDAAECAECTGKEGIFQEDLTEGTICRSSPRKTTGPCHQG